MSQKTIAGTLLAAILLVAPACKTSTSVASDSPSSTGGGSSRADLAGTYYLEDGDFSALEKITLTIRSDGTYTKVMEASSGGLKGLGGTHSGIYTASGSSVRLSGDATWPPFTHDLSAFRKIR